MATWIIIKREDNSIQGSYQADQKDDSSANRSWLFAEPICLHVELPEGLDPECVKYENEELVEDLAAAATKLTASREAKLEELRRLREPKLTRVDQLVNIAFLNSWLAAEKTELKDYRTALLDATEPYKADPTLLDALDLSTFPWPTEPSESQFTLQRLYTA